MKERCVINPTYHCLRGDVGGQILVLNSHAYVLGHYSEHTSEMVWQRVIPASDRKSIEDWLLRHFPANQAPSAPPKRTSSASA
jgi:hypothetical protein